MFDNKLINKAYEFALDKHKNQKYGDKPFIYHLLQTYELLTLLQPEDRTLRACSFLHDLGEDQGISKAEINEKFGTEIAELVYEVTATKYNTFPNLRSIRAAILLTASRLANMTNMNDWSEEKKREYVFKKSKYWLP